MKISFHGAAQTVTGSQHLIEVNDHRFLLDCGLFQGHRKEAFERNRVFEHDPAKLDRVILSHAHIDHAGNLPSLVRRGYSGDILTTDATHDMSDFMLRDSAHIQESDVRYVNKKRAREGKNLFEPLYTMSDAAETLKRFASRPYNQWFDVTPGVQARFVEAGHILGSGIVEMQVDDFGRKLKVVFSGDVGRYETPLLRDPTPLHDCDILIMESTYGGRTHGPREEIDGKLAQVVNRTANAGGKVVIPAFAVGRTQEIVYALHRLMDGNQIPRIPVYVDSPLATNISSVYRRHHEVFDREALDFMAQDEHGKVLKFPELTYTASVDESKALNGAPGPMVIISASGMCETGRILHHLRHNIGDPNSTVLIVSWQAPHTLGRRLVEKQDDVKIFGERYRRHAEVEVISGFSAHADHNGLLAWVGRDNAPRLKHVFLVHGDPEPASLLRESLLEMGVANVHIPELHQSVDV